MKYVKFILLSICAATIVNRASATQSILVPDADTYTRSAHNAGTDTLLNIYGSGAGDFMAYIRFDLSSLPASAVINDATFTVYYEPYSRADTITAGRFGNFGLLNVAGNTPQNWDEATLAEGNEGQEYGGTFASLMTGVTNGWLYNLDADASANVTETIGASTAGSPSSLTGPDLVSFLDNQRANGGLATFISAINAENGRGYGYGSRENADSSVVPTLTVDYTVVPEPSTLVLSALALAGLLFRRFRRR